jgi:hypothetical protein
MDEHKQQISRAIDRALESFFRKLRVTFKPSAVIEDLEFFRNLSRSGVFQIDNTSVEKLTQIMDSNEWGQENRTFSIKLGRSFTPGWLMDGRLAEAIEKAEAIN